MCHSLVCRDAGKNFWRPLLLTAALIAMLGATRLTADVSLGGFGEYGQAFAFRAGPIFRGTPSAEAVQELDQSFPDGGAMVRIENPATGFAATMARLSAGRTWWWWLSFSDRGAAERFLGETATDRVGNLVVEVPDLDSATIGRWRTRWPHVRAARWAAGGFDRAAIARANAACRSPAAWATGMGLDWNRADFSGAKLLFDTLFDCANDIKGGSTVKMDHPDGAQMAVFMRIDDRDARRRGAIAAAALGAGAIVHVQTSGKRGKAPIRFVGIDVAGLGAADRRLLAGFARLAARATRVVWPMAIPQNGDPWDNPFLKESNAKPAVGVVLATPGGQVALLANASDRPLKVGYPFNLGGHEMWSNQRNGGALPAGTRSLQLQPFEAVLLMPKGSAGATPPTKPVTPPPDSSPPGPGTGSDGGIAVVPPASIVPPPTPPNVETDRKPYELTRAYLQNSAAIFAASCKIVGQMRQLLVRLQSPALPLADRRAIWREVLALEKAKRELYARYKAIEKDWVSTVRQPGTFRVTPQQDQELKKLLAEMRAGHQKLVTADREMRRAAESALIPVNPNPQVPSAPGDNPGPDAKKPASDSQELADEVQFDIRSNDQTGGQDQVPTGDTPARAGPRDGF